MKYYEVHRDRTCKAIGKNSDWYKWDKDTNEFGTVANVKKFLREEYGSCKRSKMYRDGKDNEPLHIGFIYHYNTPKCSYDDQPKNNQDWVEVREITAETIIVK